MTETEYSLVPIEAIAQAILVVRGQRVILDSDLARLYGVQTRVLNQAVKRNSDRFPEDFIFQLSPEELSELITKCDRFGRSKHSSVCPYAFTEHGALMAATVLSSPRAVEVSVYVVRAFIRLRELLAGHMELSQRLAELEARVDGHDEQIGALIEAIRQLLAPPETPDRKMGYRLSDIHVPYVVNRKD